MKRRISYSEVATVLDCQAKHDFAYVGRLAGAALQRREAHIRLREGKAWGEAVAAWHGAADLDVVVRYDHGLAALIAALERDAEELREAGVYDPEAHANLRGHLIGVYAHYATTAEVMPLTHPELELLVPIPSRSGRQASTRYIFHGFLDGLTREHGDLWLVEFKLRQRLTGAAYAQLGRQYRFYAWAAERALGEPIAGVIVDERLDTAPKPARMVQGARKGDPPRPSHAKDQLCTAAAYEAACWEADVTPHPETVEALRSRKWSDRQRILFARSEIAEVALELGSASRLIQQLDSGLLYPLRNPSPMRCGGCAFRDICATPADAELVDALYERIPAKRDREEVAA